MNDGYQIPIKAGGFNATKFVLTNSAKSQKMRRGI